MSELAEKILLELDKNEKLESLKFAAQIPIDHQVSNSKRKTKKLCLHLYVFLCVHMTPGFRK